MFIIFGIISIYVQASNDALQPPLKMYNCIARISNILYIQAFTVEDDYNEDLSCGSSVWEKSWRSDKASADSADILIPQQIVWLLCCDPKRYWRLCSLMGRIMTIQISSLQRNHYFMCVNGNKTFLPITTLINWVALSLYVKTQSFNCPGGSTKTFQIVISTVPHL